MTQNSFFLLLVSSLDNSIPIQLDALCSCAECSEVFYLKSGFQHPDLLGDHQCCALGHPRLFTFVARIH
jgi:hypothetical protein